MLNPRLIKFETTDHLFLPGLLYEPEIKTKKVAIYLHGNGSSSIFYSVNRMNTIAEQLSEKGIAFFPFNNRGAHIIKSLTQKLANEEENKVYLGMTYEIIKDCVQDIDGAIHFLKAAGYTEFYLIGHSTGANKIVVYNLYKPKNEIKKYILLAGGDDTGLNYHFMGKETFELALKECKKAIDNGKGRDLVPPAITTDMISYQSLYDMINPDGDYNIFPFNEYLNSLKLSTKPLFKEYKKISKPTLVLYGENDEYCYNKVAECVGILKKETTKLKLFTFKIIPGADHSFSGKETELAESIANWL